MTLPWPSRREIIWAMVISVSASRSVVLSSKKTSLAAESGPVRTRSPASNRWADEAGSQVSLPAVRTSTTPLTESNLAVRVTVVPSQERRNRPPLTRRTSTRAAARATRKAGARLRVAGFPPLSPNRAAIHSLRRESGLGFVLRPVLSLVLSVVEGEVEGLSPKGWRRFFSSSARSMRRFPALKAARLGVGRATRRISRAISRRGRRSAACWG